MDAINELNVAALVEMRLRGDVCLVDVRSDAEVARGIIDGAIHVPLQDLPARMQDIGNTMPIVFYCHSGGRSGQACGFFARHARQNVFNLAGGVLAWLREGHALTIQQ